jgi:hypothetical protein
MPQQKVSSCKAPRALWALKRLLLCMGAFMTLQMLKSGKRSCTGCAYVRPWLVCLGRWKVRIRWPVIVGRGRLRGSASNWKSKISIDVKKTREWLLLPLPPEVLDCVMAIELSGLPPFVS